MVRTQSTYVKLDKFNAIPRTNIRIQVHPTSKSLHISTLISHIMSMLTVDMGHSHIKTDEPKEMCKFGLL